MMIDNRLIDCFLKLLKYGITGINPPVIPEGVTAKMLYDLAKQHGLCSITAITLNNLNVELNELRTKIINDYKSETLADTMQHKAFDTIMDKCCEKKVAMLPLKGAIIKKLYPSLAMRRMGDIDILIHPNDREKMKQIMFDSGYKCISYDDTNHDIYVLNQYVTVEIHTSFIPSEFKKQCEVNEMVWERATQRKSNPYVYDMCMEDVYSFHIAHAYKHYLYGGFGIKTLLDTYIILQKYPDLLDNKEIEKNLISLKLKDFKLVLERLTNIWFVNQNPNLTQYSDMTKYILLSGEYGNSKNKTVNNFVVSEHETVNKLHLIKGLVFPPCELMKANYVYVKKNIVLLPFAYIHRLFKRCLMNKEKRKIYFDYTHSPYAHMRDEKKLLEDVQI